LARRIERRFGKPQDIEWAYADGRFHILQARDITARGSAHATDTGRRECRRLVAFARDAVPTDDPLLAQNEMAEMLPRPTPVSLSLLEDLWAAGGSVDLAARRLGLDYAVDEVMPRDGATADASMDTDYGARPYHRTVFGRLYVDRREERARAPRIDRLAERRLAAAARTIEDEFRSQVLPRFLHDMRLMEATDAQISLGATSWRALNLMWVAFFAVMGAANLVVFRLFDEATWVNFKLFGMLGLTFVFIVLQSLWITARSRTSTTGDA
jgi:hypothetical protein